MTTYNDYIKTGGYFMETVSISLFKARALEFINNVSKNKTSMIITKRGKAIAQISAYSDQATEAGKLTNTLLFEGDIITPMDNEWEANQ